MGSRTRTGWIAKTTLGLTGTLCLAGCAVVERATTSGREDWSAIAAADDVAAAERSTPQSTDVRGLLAQSATSGPLSVADRTSPKEPTIQPVGHAEVEGAVQTGTLEVEGRIYRIAFEPIEEQGSPAIELAAAFGDPVLPIEPRDATDQPTAVDDVLGGEPAPIATPLAEGDFMAVPIADTRPAETITLNLASALGAIGGRHPAVGAAQWRVQEAYARLDQAEVLWLPSLRIGTSFHRHDGNYQASNGDIVDVHRSSLQAGLGVGATGAGTTQRPGIVSEFAIADAIYQPRVARKSAWAAGHASNAVMNEQLRDGALAYLELLEAAEDVQILAESRRRTAELARLTRDFADAGEGLQADADRMRTELALIDSRMVEATERSAVASTRLTQVLSIDPGRTILLADPVVTPVHLVSPDASRGSLIHAGLRRRPELKEAQALVAAACDAYKRQKVSPFVPSVLLGFSGGGFGGGLADTVDRFDERYDFDAIVAWEVRNLGFGERAARRQAGARLEQAKYEKLQRLDTVARQIDEAHAQVTFRSARIGIAQTAIQTARDSFDRNLSRIRDGEGLPIEVLQSIQALEAAQRNYLRAVADYNEAQFQLQWALGWPVDASAGYSASVEPSLVKPSVVETSVMEPSSAGTL